MVQNVLDGISTPHLEQTPQQGCSRGPLPIVENAVLINLAASRLLLLHAALHQVAADEPLRKLGVEHLLAQKPPMSSQVLGRSSKNSKPSGSFPLFPGLSPRTPYMSLLCRSNWNVHSLNPLCGFLLVGLCPPGCPMSKESVSYSPISSFAIQMLP